MLLDLYYGQQLSYEEMAAATGLSQGTLKSRLSRAREALKKILEEEGKKNG